MTIAARHGTASVFNFIDTVFPSVSFQVALVVIGVTVAGCAPQRAGRVADRTAETPSSTPVAAATAVSEDATPTPDALRGSLDLQGALEASLADHPRIAGVRSRIEAATGRKLQAGTWPNPRLSAYVDTAPASGKTTGGAEYPLGILQVVPLGGRLGAAAEVEDAVLRRWAIELEAARREVERKLRGAFAAALYSREALKLERELLDGAQRAAELARERVAAGDVASDVADRAAVEVARARLELSRATADHREALADLEETVGRRLDPSIELEGELEEVISLPALEEALDAVRRSPWVRARSAAIEASESAVDLEEARRVPDLDIGFFYRRLEATSDNAFDAGIEVALPIFDRRRGAIDAARAEVRQARAEREGELRELISRVRALYWRLEQSLEQLRIFDDELLTRSASVLRASRTRFEAGDASLSDVLADVQSHHEFERARLDRLRQIAIDWSQLRSLIAAEAP